MVPPLVPSCAIETLFSRTLLLNGSLVRIGIYLQDMLGYVSASRLGLQPISVVACLMDPDNIEFVMIAPKVATGPTHQHRQCTNRAPLHPTSANRKLSTIIHRTEASLSYYRTTIHQTEASLTMARRSTRLSSRGSATPQVYQHAKPHPM
jgi:short subunit dehydrogenase-like uncharacterized protein